MPYIETPAELAESLADQLGVYGAEKRSEWVADVTQRIREAAKNEQRLQSPLMGFRKERNDFLPPTFCRCSKCGDEYAPGIDHVCSEDER